jgi:hypothetical protein
MDAKSIIAKPSITKGWIAKTLVPPYSSGRSSRWFRLDFVWVFVCLCAASILVPAQTQDHPRQGKNSKGGGVDRGKYIVESVAMCGQCHTPHNSDGTPDRAQWLRGAPVPWVPLKPDPNWPISAPRIGGTPLPASDADMVKLLMTGIWTTGNRLRPPMPQFRMDQGDAEAVVAYLKSVNTQQ